LRLATRLDTIAFNAYGGGGAGTPDSDGCRTSNCYHLAALPTEIWLHVLGMLQVSELGRPSTTLLSPEAARQLEHCTLEHRLASGLWQCEQTIARGRVDVARLRSQLVEQQVQHAREMAELRFELAGLRRTLLEVAKDA
jgi:hypothetical protein